MINPGFLYRSMFFFVVKSGCLGVKVKDSPSDDFPFSMGGNDVFCVNGVESSVILPIRGGGPEWYGRSKG